MLTTFGQLKTTISRLVRESSHRDVGEFHFELDDFEFDDPKEGLRYVKIKGTFDLEPEGAPSGGEPGVGDWYIDSVDEYVDNGSGDPYHTVPVDPDGFESSLNPTDKWKLNRDVVSRAEEVLAWEKEV